jgi:hypothetical protein
MEPDEDSPGSSEYSSGSTLLPKSTGTADNLESSLNLDIGTEMKATHLESSLNQDSGTEMKAAHLENSLNQDIGTEMKATQFEAKKEECEGVEGVVSTGKVEQGKLIPFCKNKS